MLALLYCSTWSHAWSAKEHIQFTRLAAERMIDDPATPTGLKAFLTDALPKIYSADEEKNYYLTARIGATRGDAQTKLEYWAVAPDVHAMLDEKNSVVQPFGVHERLMHFIDLEYFQKDRKLGYRDDLSGKTEPADVPNDAKDSRWARAGMLPFAVQHSYEKLIEAFRAGRVTVTESKDPASDDAVRWAGYLAHYVQDNTQPHHATIDYKSQTYFPGIKNPPNVHAEIEYRMVDDDKGDFKDLRELYWPMFNEFLKTVVDPVKADKPWDQTIEIAHYSYDALPLIGRAAASAKVVSDEPKAKPDIDTEKFFRHEETYRGEKTTVLKMKAQQNALAVIRTQRLWLAAWNEAAAGK